MKEECWHIGFASSQQHLIYCLVLMYSIVANNPGRRICFYVVCGEGELEHDKKLCKEAWEHTENVRVIYLSPDAEAYKKIIFLHSSYYGGQAITLFSRWDFADALPHVSRLLYLDIDMIVDGKIDELMEMDLGDNFVGMAKDPFWKYGYGRYTDKWMSPGFPYCQAGLLLMDLDAWRKYRVKERLIRTVEKYKEQFLYVDQDAVNVALAGKIKLLDRKWDCTVQFTWQDNENKEEVMKRAVIYHYCGGPKPWWRGTGSYYKHIWWKYARKLDDDLATDVLPRLLASV